eukprot:CAMPEP_0183415266 /NCGR_PEP_ID=MMETSP0370-20130417/22973_1 /TAXON_ID=268820 /ORGANISM="Peridinium aciculiferum, Strain PAER-2" /LENGTH=93 /DNA_ID=CAMNT_0025598671 /DNA_START=147 /DNA_END=428 /DNA_ORIENTATION=+
MALVTDTRLDATAPSLHVHLQHHRLNLVELAQVFFTTAHPDDKTPRWPHVGGLCALRTSSGCRRVAGHLARICNIDRLPVDALLLQWSLHLLV